VWINRNLWLDPDLSTNEKVMLVEINSLDSEDRGCFARNAHFAKFFSLSISRVSEVINSLARRGYIAIEEVREDGVTERRIRMLRDLSAPPSENRRVQETPTPPSENTKAPNKERGTDEVNTPKPPKGGKGLGPHPFFEEFWAQYPNRSAKKTASARFSRINPDRALLDRMLAALAQQKTTDQWIRGFIPHASTWLNQERWNDEVESDLGCEPEKVMALYNELLPSLPRAETLFPKRRIAIQNRWRWLYSTCRKGEDTPRASNPDEALAWMHDFFTAASQCQAITSPGPAFTPDLDYLMGNDGLKRVFEKANST
jgi:hypothetical protein